MHSLGGKFALLTIGTLVKNRVIRFKSRCGNQAVSVKFFVKVQLED